MGDFGSWLTIVATAMGIIGSMTGAFTWIAKKNEESNRKNEQKMANAIKEALTPLTYELRDLNNNLNDSKEDRQKIHCELDAHDEILDNHETRITVLEKYKF